MAFWVTVEDTHSDEVLLQRKLTSAEMNESGENYEAKQAYRIAEEAFCGELKLDPKEASSHPHLAPVLVTYYRQKKDIGGVVCWSSHGFYPAE
jgi:hypothetical protein